MRKYFLAYDEALMAANLPLESTCDRAKGQPHRHYVALQLETDDVGNIVNSIVTPNLHAKEVIDAVPVMSNAGAQVFIQKELEKRVKENNFAERVTLRREADAQGTHLFIDIRNKEKEGQKIVTSLAQYPDTAEAYKTARVDLLVYASNHNLPFYDYIDQEVK